MISIRDASHEDLPIIVDLLLDDGIGKRRESRSLEAYGEALAAIDADPNHRFVIAESKGRIVGCFQLSFIPGLSRRGGRRGQIESVRVVSEMRGQGLGRQMMLWAIEECRRRGCGLVQLTTDKRRDDAHRFYLTLGFEASHEGMKLPL